MIQNRRKEFFPNVTDEQWNDWHWQVKNRIETVDQLKKYIDLTEEEEDNIRKSLNLLRMSITPYYLSLIDTNNPNCPIRQQAVPSKKELYKSPSDLDDPLDEDEDSPVPGLTHRYPDRVLFLITDMCSMYCRHCTRRRFAGHTDAGSSTAQIDACIDYIARTPQVRDVLLSGGDALLVSDSRLEYIIKKLREIPHVEIIRIGSRTPVVMPQRITEKLIASYPFDFVIGSIHFLAGWDFTNPANIKGFALKDAEKIYVDYFQLLKEMAAADLFDIVGHADVVKKFGHLIDEEAAGEIRREAVAAIKKHGLCVEVNTSGWRAPVGEQYPSRSFLSDCFQRDIPVTLGSDAHSPGDVGKGFPEALALLKEIGYDRLATFNKRKRSFIAL